MSEIERIAYTNKELLQMMIEKQGIHEGNWILSVKYKFTAMHIGQTPDGSDACPASVSAIDGIGIERVPEPLPYSIDASKSNPK